MPEIVDPTWIALNVECVRKAFKGWPANHIIASSQAASSNGDTIYFDPQAAFWKKHPDGLDQCQVVSNLSPPPGEPKVIIDASVGLPSTVWGPKKWDEFHGEQNPTLTWVNEFVKSLPRIGCSCRGDFKDEVARNPPPPDNAPKVYWDWWRKDRHDAVSARLGKPTFTDQAAIEKYGFDPRPATPYIPPS